MIVFPMFAYLKDEFSVSDLKLGALGSILILVNSLAVLPLGYWSERGNRQKIMAGGVLFWSLATTLSGFAATFKTLLTARALVGVGEAAFGALFSLGGLSRGADILLGWRLVTVLVGLLGRVGAQGRLGGQGAAGEGRGWESAAGVGGWSGRGGYDGTSVDGWGREALPRALSARAGTLVSAAIARTAQGTAAGRNGRRRCMRAVAPASGSRFAVPQDNLGAGCTPIGDPNNKGE